jgi:hypothetical protein
MQYNGNERNENGLIAGKPYFIGKKRVVVRQDGKVLFGAH